MVQVEGHDECPASRPEDRPRFLRRRVSPLSQQASRPDAPGSSKWDELPESLLQTILNKVETVTQGWQTLRTMFAAMGVCRSWRQAAETRLFKGMWEHPPPMTLSHPAQLFALSPRKDSALVKCYIVRESQAGKLGSGSVLYRLYLGSDPTSSNSKFLLSATQHPWQHTSIFLNAQGTGMPCAKMMSNVLGTSHKLTRCDPSFFAGAGRRPELGNELPRTETLASVKYKLRMKGMMRPRRLHVSLPKPSTDEEESDLAGTSARRRGFLERICSRHHAFQSVADSSSRDVAATATDTPPTSQKLLSRHSSRLTERSSKLKLVNKPPHWNEGLKCWCLNFRGRVKLASVKNFQLICDSDGAGRIVMQFGKVEANIFIMDFNPRVITTVQAFSIALTSFEGKVLL